MPIEVATLIRLVPRWITFVVAGFAAESAAAEPRFVCYPVMPGDTVTAISVRLTRDSRSWRGPGFQIFDPAAARFVSKGNYNHIRPGWQACVAQPSVARLEAPHPAGGQMIWWPLILLGALCSAAVATLLVIQLSLDRRKATQAALQRFGAAFISEFERPLIDERGPRSGLRAELAVSPDRRSGEVRLAPVEGRRYPNLADHRTNVEYDVKRVVSALNDRRFICGPLRAYGAWVAIPFRLKTELRKEGGP
jgi:hypothetical protein